MALSQRLPGSSWTEMRTNDTTHYPLKEPSERQVGQKEMREIGILEIRVVEQEVNTDGSQRLGREI